MRRLFPLSTAASLSLAAAGCAPAKADVDILDLDGDGIDDALQGGDGDGGGDDAPDTPGDEPDEPGDDPEASLQGDWALTSFPGYEGEVVYEGDYCTYTQSYTFAMSIGAGEDGAYEGNIVVDYTWSADGEDCPYAGESGSGRERFELSGEALGDREYQIRVRDWDLRMVCELDSSGDELYCDIGMTWEREG